MLMLTLPGRWDTEMLPEQGAGKEGPFVQYLLSATLWVGVPRKTVHSPFPNWLSPGAATHRTPGHLVL